MRVVFVIQGIDALYWRRQRRENCASRWLGSALNSAVVHCYLEKIIMSTERAASERRDSVASKEAKARPPQALAEILMRHADDRILPGTVDVKLQSQFRHGGDR